MYEGLYLNYYTNDMIKDVVAQLTKAC